MRPIDQNSSGLAYSAADALAREVVTFAAPAKTDEEPPAPIRSTVGAEADRLEALLAASHDPTGRWASDEDRAEAERIAGLIGRGYEAAAGGLIDRTGPYCAYCEAAEPTGLRADPIRPAAWFPREAFDPANLLLACAPCRDRKRTVLTRASGQLAWEKGPIAPLWPHLYWQGLGSPSPLRFRHRLYEGGGGGAADLRPVSIDRARELVVLCRQGRLTSELHARRAPRLAIGPLPEPGVAATGSGLLTYLYAWVEPGGTSGADTAASRQTIDMLDLNCLAGNPDDRRQELRGRAWLEALDLWERLDAVGRMPEPDPDLRAAIEALRDTAIRATGFWGVWLEIFGDSPGFQQHLAGLMPGTAAVPLWEH